MAGSSASFVLRAPEEPGLSEGVLEAGLVLSTPGVPPFSFWARFPTGPEAEEEGAVHFFCSGVGLSESASFILPWVWRGAGNRWDIMPDWAAKRASIIGHPSPAAREAVAVLAGMVLEPVSETWAVALVRRACAMVSPRRVAELVQEVAVEQVMES